MEADMSLVSLVSRASTLVQLVMLVLLCASVVSWFIIFQKNKLLKTVSAEAIRGSSTPSSAPRASRDPARSPGSTRRGCTSARGSGQVTRRCELRRAGLY